MIKLRKLINEDSNDSLSEESLNFLKSWMWNKSELRKYQKKGISAIPDQIVDELRHFRPNKEKEVFRVFGSLEKEMESRSNKLLSFSPSKPMSLSMWEDQTTVGHPGSYIYRVKVNPDAILVDTSSFYNNYPDISPEVIVITEQANLK